MKSSFGLAGLAGIISIAITTSAAEPGGAYVNVDAGPSFLHDVKIKDAGGARAKFDVGLRSDISVGYRFSESCAGEIETGLIWNSVRRIGTTVPPPTPGGGGYAAYQRGDADLYQIPLLANALYFVRCPKLSALQPYVGVGVGGIATVLDSEFPAGDVNDTDFTFAYQAFTGVKYACTDRISIGAAYKFLGTLDHHWEGSGLDVRTRSIFTHAIVAVLSIGF